MNFIVRNSTLFVKGSNWEYTLGMNQDITKPEVWNVFWADCLAELEIWVEHLLSDVIPPWCSGIDPAFWDTDAGKQIASLLWLVHGHEALTLEEAGRELYGKWNQYYRGRVQERLNLYPLVPEARKTPRFRRYRYQYYVLASQVAARKAAGHPPRRSK